MKRKTLTTAVLAGLTGVAGMVGVSNAVNINPDGLGQVLIYPYYTARGGNSTLISVVNTTDQAKALKIRFLEGRNSREVLDFNIYMSAFDVWTGAIRAVDDAEGAELAIADRTCTVPDFVRNSDDGVGIVPFVEFEFSDNGGATPDLPDGAGQTRERTESGYLEIIEMGTLVDDNGVNPAQNSATAVTHVDGEPADCSQLVDAWTELQGGGPVDETSYWVAGADGDPGLDDSETDLEEPSGGVFGSASIINVGEGTLLSYNAEAVDNWSEAISHSNPADVRPRIVDGSIQRSAVFLSGVQDVDIQDWFDPRDAVNAILMNNQVLNEFALSPNTDSLTEWVLTFPTKRFHVDPGPRIGITDPVPPFSVLFEEGSACEPITFRVWDREENELQDDPVGVSPPEQSPQPPGPPPTIDTFDLCFESNVVRFVREGAGDNDQVNGDTPDTQPAATEILGEPNFTTLFVPPSFISGWAQFNFDPEEIDPGLGFPATARRISSADGVDYVGLPVVGFQASTVTNNTLVVDGNQVLSNYAGAFRHRGSRRIEATPPPQP